MAQINTREVVLFPPTATAAGTTPGADINIIQGFQSAIVTLNVTAVGGTSLDVYVQKKLGQAQASDLAGGFPTGTAIYDDILHFPQVTAGTGVTVAQLTTGPLNSTANATAVTTATWAQSDAGALAAGSVRVGPLGGLWRVKFIQVGAGFTWSCSVQLIPFST
jgi:hypothetical protein